jgi:hypothetical protein
MTERAYERDEEGCYLEPSERVRQALIDAINTCCPCRPGEGPMQGQIEDVRPMDVRPMDVRPMDARPPAGGNVPMPMPSATDDGAEDRQARGSVSDLDSATFTPASTKKNVKTSSRRTWQNRAVQVSAEEEVEVALPATTTRAIAPPIPSAQATQTSDAPFNVPAVAGPLRGYVVASNKERGLVELHFAAEAKPAKGDEVLVYHTYLFGRELVGQLTVVSYDGDHVIARFNGTKTFKIASGDEAIVDNPSVLSRR